MAILELLGDLNKPSDTEIRERDYEFREMMFEQQAANDRYNRQYDQIQNRIISTREQVERLKLREDEIKNNIAK